MDAFGRTRWPHELTSVRGPPNRHPRCLRCISPPSCPQHTQTSSQVSSSSANDPPRASGALSRWEGGRELWGDELAHLPSCPRLIRHVARPELAGTYLSTSYLFQTLRTTTLARGLRLRVLTRRSRSGAGARTGAGRSRRAGRYATTAGLIKLISSDTDTAALVCLR